VFIRGVVAKGEVDLDAIIKFGTETDEALFLFDETIDEYLSSIYQKAIRLRTVNQLSKRSVEDQASHAQEDAQLLLWFTEQFGQARYRFAPFLRLTS
jgi:hypothetical protein